MKKIGLIGGLSWESTRYYYEIFNTEVKRRLGASNSCPCLINSVNFQEIADLQKIEDWDRMSAIMAESAIALERAGADIILLGTNTMHLCADAIVAAVNIPFLHIADATGAEIAKNNLSNVLLLGTRFTMEKDLYKARLLNSFGIQTMVPDQEERTIVNTIIYEELVHGVFDDDSRFKYQEIIQKYANQGAEGVILGCTEIPLLIKPEHVSIPVFDTSRIHALQAIDAALT